MSRARLLYNPNAGRFPPDQAAGIAAGRLRQHGWAVEILATNSAEDVTALAREAAQEKFDVVIIAGGDGSVGRVAAGLHGSGTAMAVLPTGTANVWAKELGLPVITPRSASHIERAADLIAESRPRRIDIGFCNGIPFLLWAGIGLDALVVRQAEKKRSHFRKIFAYPEYALRALRYAAGWPGVRIQLAASRPAREEKLTLDGIYQLAVISNIRLYAGGIARISPNARINDGEMDLWLFQGRGFLAACRNAWQLIRGTHLGAPACRVIPFSDLAIQLDSPTYLHADGDPLPENRQVHIQVQRQSLRAMLPQMAPNALLQ